jgi:hypothetical protein
MAGPDAEDGVSADETATVDRPGDGELSWYVKGAILFVLLVIVFVLVIDLFELVGAV